MLFSASHFLIFVERTIYHITQTITVLFDFIQNTRLENPVDYDFCRYLSSFINKIRAFFISYKDLGSFIASTLLLDIYLFKIYSKLETPQRLIPLIRFRVRPYRYFPNLIQKSLLRSFPKGTRLAGFSGYTLQSCRGSNRTPFPRY